MGLIPFKRSYGKAKSQDKQRGRMPKRHRGSMRENKTTSVGTAPTAAPPVDGSIITHDTNYPRRAPRKM